MTALAVIEHFDIFKDTGFGLLSGLIVFEIGQFGFQGVEKGFSDSVVVAVAFAAHTGLDTSALEQLSQLAAGVLPALV